MRQHSTTHLNFRSAALAFVLMPFSVARADDTVTLDLNSATATEMQRFFVVPMKKQYEAIVESRQTNGPCESPAQLARDGIINQLARRTLEVRGGVCGADSGSSSNAQTSADTPTTPSLSADEAAEVRDAYNSYKKLGSVDGWVEFLTTTSFSDYTAKARSGLASKLDNKTYMTVDLSSIRQVKCKGISSLSQSEVLSNVGTLGSKWDYYCDKGDFTYTVTNPTQSTIFASGSAYSSDISFVLPPGGTAKGHGAMKSACKSGDIRYSPAKITAGCDAVIRLSAADVVDAELEAYPGLLTSTDSTELTQFLTAFPTSVMRDFATDRLEQLNSEKMAAIQEQLEVSMALGPEPSRMIDPQDYTLTISNPTSSNLVVTVKHEGKYRDTESEVAVSAGSTSTLNLQAKPSQAPDYSISGVTVAE